MAGKWTTFTVDGLPEARAAVKRLQQTLKGPKAALCLRVLQPLIKRVLDSMKTRWSQGAPYMESLYNRTGSTMRYLSEQQPELTDNSAAWGAADDNIGRRVAFLEKGGTIVPKAAKALAIPLPGALKASGALQGRFDAADGLRNCGVAMFMVKREGKAPLLCEALYGRGGSSPGKGKEGPSMPKALTPLFILKSSQEIGEHPTFHNAVRDGGGDVDAMLPGAVRAFVEAAR